MSYPQPVQKLIQELRRLPGVGPKTATRYAFYLVHSPEEKIKAFQNILQELHDIKLCKNCFKHFDRRQDKELCPICRNEKRDSSLLCIVEKEADLNSIEKIQSYRGLYFIIGEARLFFDSSKLKKRLTVLLKRIKNNSEIKEVILAINSTPEGQALINFLKKQLSKTNVKISQLRQGLPRGAELEYADSQTLKSALEERKINNN